MPHAKRLSLVCGGADPAPCAIADAGPWALMTTPQIRTLPMRSGN